ncbi:MAG: hypothetical protein K6A82_07365 [Prevotella sp.]|nr:hypothetical protein [Prevotella sp.]
MKHFSRYLVAFLVLLMIPIAVSAQNAKLHFWNGSTPSVEINPVMGGWTGSGWSQDIDGADLAPYVSAENKLYFLLVIDYNGIHWYHTSASTSAFGNGTSATFDMTSPADAFVNMPVDYQNYIFTFKVENWTNTGNSIKMTVSWRSNEKYELLTSGGTWKEVTTGVRLYDTNFPIQLRKTLGGGAQSYFRSASSSLADGATLAATQETDPSQATSYTTAESDANGFILDITASSLTLHKVGEADNYYFVSPELTGGQRLPAFRLIPSRQRHGGALSTTLFSLNLKDDVIKKIHSDTIHYHIEKGDGTESYRPHHSGNDNYALGATGTLSTKNNNVKSQTYDDTRTKAGGAFANNNFALATGTGVSYTWLFDATGTAPLTIDINLKPLSESSSKTYYAIGNYGDALATANIQPYETSGRTKMTRLLYYKDKPGIGFPDATTDFDAAQMDSVIYRVTVPRPDAGWGELYMAVAEASLVDGSSAANWGTNWDKVIRPQVQAYGTPASGSNSASGMDATALEGGIFWGEKTSNKSQALNPQLTTRYANATSYTFSINLTTSTYRISFNTEQMYIMGSSVAASNDGAENVTGVGSIPTGHSVYALPLTWDGSEQCFKYMKDGVETAIVMNNDATTGNRFRFVYNKDFTNPWFGENYDNTKVHPNIPVDLTASDKPYTAAAPRYDTQYVNYLNTYQSSENKYGDPTKDIKFLLPQKKDGTGYIVRFYIKKVGDEVDYFYTINRKISFNEFNLSDAQKLDGMKYYRAFSEWHACKLPKGVRMYIVTATDASSKTATLKELTGYNYIPARTGVVLATNEAKKIGFETYAENPEATLAEMNITEKNMLVAQEANVDIPTSTSTDDGTKYNYILGVYKKPADSENKLGFYHPAAGVKSGRNYSFLQVNDNITVGAKGFMFLFDDSVVNGISMVEAEDNVSDDSAYYNLQGVKVDKPTAKGIYIHNGKKYIVR